MICRDLHKGQKHNFGDRLRKFDGNWTIVIDFVSFKLHA